MVPDIYSTRADIFIHTNIFYSTKLIYLIRFMELYYLIIENNPTIAMPNVFVEYLNRCAIP